MTNITNNIELLQERLNQMIANKDDNIKLYELSTELDTWIVEYYKQNKQ